MELEDMKFQCCDCPDVYGYSEAQDHTRKCKAFAQPCVLGCKSLPHFGELNYMEKHLVD
jgi:hypothetical protein